MPSGIGPSDRKLLKIAGVVLVLMLVASAILAPPPEQAGAAIPSSYSNESGGARAAYLLLTQLHYPVRRWEASPTELPGQPDDVLIVADPVQPPSEKERKALRQFVEIGGRVLFTGSNLHMFFRDAELSQEVPDAQWKTFSPIMPNRFASGAQHVVMHREASWGRLRDGQLALYGDAETKEVVVVVWQVGDGEIIWWAGPTPLTNAGVTHEDNLSFFLASLGARENIDQIYWDEYFHGQRSSLWSYVQKTSLPWGLMQLGLLAAAILFSFSRRRGPLYVPPARSRLSPLEFVDTLAGLYEKAGAASPAVSVSYQRLRSLLTHQLGLPNATPDAQLCSAVTQRFGWPDADFAPLMARAETSVHAPKLRPGEALELVQQLERYASRLSIRSQLRMEKN